MSYRLSPRQSKWQRRLLSDWRWRLNDTFVLGRDVPDVAECHGFHGSKTPQGSCAQCDGKHAHKWRHTLIPEHADFAYRCQHCGARNCDLPGCSGRRHHSDAHVFASGSVRGVGS